jgi:hypothetical protein
MNLSKSRQPNMKANRCAKLAGGRISSPWSLVNWAGGKTAPSYIMPGLCKMSLVFPGRTPFLKSINVRPTPLFAFCAQRESRYGSVRSILFRVNNQSNENLQWCAPIQDR